MIFLVKNLPAVIHASGTAKMLGTSEQSFRGHGEEENCCKTSSCLTCLHEHGLATGEGGLTAADLCCRGARRRA